MTGLGPIGRLGAGDGRRARRRQDRVIDATHLKATVKYAKRRYQRRNHIEIMFGGPKDWRRVATRHDRCPKVFLAAIVFAALAIYFP